MKPGDLAHFSNISPVGLATHVHLESVDSTNSYARQSCGQMNATDLPCLITCDQQTAGRGRGTNRWIHAQGNLAFSLVIDRGNLPLSEAHWIGLWTAVCLQQCASTFLPHDRCELKWPNDLIINDRKNAGILMESMPANPDRVIVGIGLNLCHLPEPLNGGTRLADELSYFAWLEAGQKFQRTIVLQDFLQRWLKLDFQLPQQRMELLKAFRACDWLHGQEIEITANGSTQTGQYAGLSEQGFLLLKLPDEPEISSFASCERVRRVKR